ncbi:MAG: glycosyltransferase family 39 protein, partial [Candidatus Micrarchaeota archaeon]|nr:glycosyltransferase family 39 protein [Candidatus Micrarchaeota archaeon]
METDASRSHRRHARTSTAQRARPISVLVEKKWVWIALAAIILYAIWYSVSYADGPSFFGDDNAYAGLANQILTSNFHEGGYIFSVRPLQIYPIALSFWALGINIPSSSAWDSIAFIGTVIACFFIGKELYNEYAGLLSALLMAFFPLVTVLAVSMSDNVPMMFVSALAFMCLIYAMKYSSKRWYMAAGIFTIAAPLTTPEAYITLIALFSLVAIELLRGKIKLDKTTIYFAYGLIAASAILMAFNFASSGDPLITFTVNENYFSAIGQQNTIPAADQSLTLYPSVMFPFNLWQLLLQNFPNLLGVISGISILGNYNQVGFYFYLLIPATAYLLLRRERRAYIPLYWFLFTFLYLEFGPMHVGLSPFEYLFSHKVGRFLCLCAVPLVVTIAMASARSLEPGSLLRRYAAASIVCASVALLVLTGFLISAYWHTIVVHQTYDQVVMAGYLSQQPPSTKIYFTGTFSNMLLYMRFENMSRFYAYDNIKNCSQIPDGAYIV